MVKIGADNSGLKSALKDSQSNIKTAFATDPVKEFTNALEGTTGSVGSLISRFSGLAAVAAGGFGFAALIDNAVNAGNAAYEMAQRLGVSNQEAINLSRVLSMSGTDVAMFNSAIMRLDKSFYSTGNSGQLCRDTLTATGVALTDANGKMLPLTEQLANMAQGYEKAKASGQQQVFLMNTLGVKGLQLTKVFEEYNEKMKIASETNGVGLNPEEMHKLSLEMDALKIQSSQIGLVFGSALAPIAAEVFPPILTGLKNASTFLAQNKAGVIGVTEEILKLYAAYKLVNLGKSAINTVSNLAQGLGSNAGERAAASELTAFQEKAVERSVAASERGYMRKINAAVRAAQAESASADEAAAQIAVAMQKITAESDAASIAIRERMTAAFLGAAASAEESAIIINTALAGTGTAAVEAATVKTAATVGSAEACTAAVVESSLVQEGSITAVGVAAEVAGAKEVEASESAVVAANKVTVAQGEVAAAEVVAGDTAVIAGTKMEASCISAGGAVKSLGNLVLALAGGWIGVGVAASYAAYEITKAWAAHNRSEVKQYQRIGLDPQYMGFQAGTSPMAFAIKSAPPTEENGQYVDMEAREQAEAEKAKAEKEAADAKARIEALQAGIGILPTAEGKTPTEKTKKEAAPKESAEQLAADRARHKEIEDANKFVEQMNKIYDGMFLDQETVSQNAYQKQLDDLKKWHDDGLVSEEDYTADLLKLSQMRTVNLIAEAQKQLDAERGYKQSALDLVESLQKLKDASLTGSAAAAVAFQREWDNALKNVKKQVDDIVSQLNSMKEPGERNKKIRVYQDSGMMNQGDFTGKAVTSEDFSTFSQSATEAVNKKFIQDSQDEDTIYNNWRKNLDIEYNQGHIQKYQQMLNDKQNLDHNYLEGQKAYMTELQTLWNQTHKSIYDKYATLLSDMDSGLTSALTNFISGTSSGKDAFRSFADSVIDSIIKMEAQAAAANITSSISKLLGIGTSTSTASSSSSDSSSSLLTSAISLVSQLADGGAVYGPGTGTSDSIPAMLSNGEYVLTANATSAIGVSNLDRINKGYASGGLVTGPSLASLSNYGNVSNVSSAGSSRRSVGSSSNQSSVTMNIYAQDVRGAKQSQSQMMAEAYNAMSRARRNV